MPPHGQSNPSPPWTNPAGDEVLIDLLFQNYRPTEPMEPVEDPFLQEIEQQYHLEMPSVWVEQAKRWPLTFRLNSLL
jgi:hypothetical protein